MNPDASGRAMPPRMLTVVPAGDSPPAPQSPPTSAELLLENERLRETLEVLKSGLQDGHRSLAESLQNILSASSSDAETQAVRLSERQVALYTAFLTNAVAIAADAAQLSDLSASSRKKHGRRRKSSFREWLTKRVSSRYRRSPQRIAPPG